MGVIIKIGIKREDIMKLETIAERFSDARHTYNSDYIKDWKNKDVKLLTSLLKPEYKDINFKLNFFSLIFNSKIISKLKNLNTKKIVAIHLFYQESLLGVVGIKMCLKI